MKKVMLAIMATFTLAGLLSSTTVSANTQKPNKMSQEFYQKLLELCQGHNNRLLNREKATLF
ncbi:hypothetical protein K6973_03705 [Streptococcus dysgalactiae]|uniref:hypothetical protein n=1 Tax=Streptococcus dysgalactiae TaxID=1334 RepID=UPI001C9E03A5|nr:hypothetical protein [Streptococcus dysgalactiae]QZT28310.1 hypothetical protein K6973_03705 [Streptococcus dysgalactiae]